MLLESVYEMMLYEKAEPKVVRSKLMTMKKNHQAGSVEEDWERMG